MNRRRTAQSAFLNLRTSIVVLVCALAGYSVLNATLLGFFGPQASLKVSGRTLSFAERVSYQRAIEEVYWRHRIWPENHPDQKPPLDSGMSQAQVEKKVADYLRKSQALQDYWQRPITAEELQAEMDRMAVNTKQPDVLRELFETLGNDPLLSRSVWRGQSRRNVYSPDWTRTKDLPPSRDSLMRRRKCRSQSRGRGG